MNISLTIIKATLMATIIFWLIIFSKNFHPEMLFLVLLSIIPISICCALAISLTIAPFFWLQKDSTNYKTVYNTYFPFYAFVLFGFCTYSIISSNFNAFSLAFFTSAFITSLKSWSWIIEPENPLT